VKATGGTVLGLPLGPYPTDRFFSFGFNVEVRGQVTGQSKITDASIHQYLFLWLKVIDANNKTRYYLFDETHDNGKGGPEKVNRDAALVALQEWKNDDETFGDDTKLQKLLKNPGQFKVIKVAKKLVEWSDLPGLGPEKARRYKSAKLLMHVKIELEGSDGKKVTKGFTRFQYGKVDQQTGFWKILEGQTLLNQP
jgi:hypothetical protein